jgi:hypothetical protein
MKLLYTHIMPHKKEVLINPCGHCPYKNSDCSEIHVKEFKIRVGDKIQIGIPLVGGTHLWGSNQEIINIDSDGTPWYRAKWSKVNKPAYCFRVEKE